MDKCDVGIELSCMDYQEWPPSPALATIVRCYWTLRADATPLHAPSRAGGAAVAGAPEAEPALPDGSPELIFNLGDPFEQVLPDGRSVRQPDAFLVGQITRPMVVGATGRTDLVAARLEAHGAVLLTSEPRALIDRWIGINDFPSHALHGVHAALQQADSPGERVALLDAALARLATTTIPPDARVVAAVRAIRASHGAVNLEAMCRDMRVTMRTLQRLFGRDVGLSPKYLARIVRFQRVVRAWRADAHSLARVAAECGYFDQSHLIRDFRDFAGDAPAGFLAELPAFTALFLD